MQPEAFASMSAADRPRSEIGPATLKRGAMTLWQRRNVEAYVDANLHSTIRMAELARVAECGRCRFKHSFKEAFGCTPHQYVMRRRVERAQELMIISRASLSQISAECGFVDQFHLSHLFHRIVGQPPSTWRRSQMSLYRQVSQTPRQSPADHSTNAASPAA